MQPVHRVVKWQEIKTKGGDMRKITRGVTTAFLNRVPKTMGNTHTDGTALYLHGNKIAEYREDELYITSAGWETNTTKERLNALPGVSITQKNWNWYLNSEPWNGQWVKV